MASVLYYFLIPFTLSLVHLKLYRQALLMEIVGSPERDLIKDPLLRDIERKRTETKLSTRQDSKPRPLQDKYRLETNHMCLSQQRERYLSH